MLQKTVAPRTRLSALALPCALWCVFNVGSVRAQTAAPDGEQGEADLQASRQLEPGVLPTLLAVVPGMLVRGSGTYLAKDKRAATRLLLTAATGLGLFLAGGSVLAATGTSRRLASAISPVVFLGSALFFSSWLADIYGASTGGRDALGQTTSPRLEAELGYRYVYDPQFAYRSFAFVHGDLRYRSFRATPSAWLALDDDNQRVTLDLAHRFLGRQAGESGNDGSFADLTHGLVYHRYGSEGFLVWTPTLALEGRLDLRHVAPALRGAFVEGQLGAGVEVYAFTAPAAQARDDAFGLLLARWAFGVYFGSGLRRTGEATVYYDHRHDDFAAGLGVNGIASGIAGHIGTAAHYDFDEHWGVGALFEVGSAVVTGLSARYRVVPTTGSLVRP